MRAPLWLLTLITFSGTLAMHIFVPALPEAAHALGATIGEMQLTMSVYIFGLAVGQLAYGPLSDRYGRRPVLVSGLVLYTLAGFAACFIGDVHHLIVARLLQALGGCAGMVIGRASDQCDLVVAHATVSRRHARLSFAGEALQIEDIGSTNGTSVNGAAVKQGGSPRPCRRRPTPCRWRPRCAACWRRPGAAATSRCRRRRAPRPPNRFARACNNRTGNRHV